MKVIILYIFARFLTTTSLAHVVQRDNEELQVNWGNLKENVTLYNCNKSMVITVSTANNPCTSVYQAPEPVQPP